MRGRRVPNFAARRTRRINDMRLGRRKSVNVISPDDKLLAKSRTQ